MNKYVVLIENIVWNKIDRFEDIDKCASSKPNASTNFSKCEHKGICLLNVTIHSCWGTNPSLPLFMLEAGVQKATVSYKWAWLVHSPFTWGHTTAFTRVTLKLIAVWNSSKIILRPPIYYWIFTWISIIIINIYIYIVRWKQIKLIDYSLSPDILKIGCGLGLIVVGHT